MAVLLKVLVGGKNFPIETNLDLENAVTAIRNPENRGGKIAIFINQYYFPAASMTVLERSTTGKSKTARELESNVEQDFQETFGDDEDGMFDDAEFMSSDMTRQAEHLNGIINMSFRPAKQAGSYFRITSLKRAFNVLLGAIGGCPFSVILT